MVVGAKASILKNAPPERAAVTGFPLALRVVIAIDDAPRGSQPYLHTDAEIAETQLESKELKETIRLMLNQLADLLDEAGCGVNFADGVGEVDVVDETDREIDRGELHKRDYPELAESADRIEEKAPVLYGPGGGRLKL